MTERQIMCLKLKLGSCAGCNVLTIAIRNARWKSLNLDVAKRTIAKEYCPPGLLPMIELMVNHDAIFAMGQRRKENTDWED